MISWILQEVHDIGLSVQSAAQIRGRHKWRDCRLKRNWSPRPTGCWNADIASGVLNIFLCSSASRRNLTNADRVDGTKWVCYDSFIKLPNWTIQYRHFFETNVPFFKKYGHQRPYVFLRNHFLCECFPKLTATLQQITVSSRATVLKCTIAKCFMQLNVRFCVFPKHLYKLDENYTTDVFMDSFTRFLCTFLLYGIKRFPSMDFGN